jgi:hypothetical protein
MVLAGVAARLTLVIPSAIGNAIWFLARSSRRARTAQRSAGARQASARAAALGDDRGCLPGAVHVVSLRSGEGEGALSRRASGFPARFLLARGRRHFQALRSGDTRPSSRGTLLAHIPVTLENPPFDA